MSDATDAITEKPPARRGRPVRTPGASMVSASAEPATAAGLEVVADDEQPSLEDPRTPGLRVQDDGSVFYAGRVHRKPFMTPHGMVVPACSVEPGNAALRR